MYHSTEHLENQIDRLRAELTKEKADADSLRAELAEIGGDQRLSAELAEWQERHPYGEVDLDMAIEAEAKDLKLRIDALESAQIDYEAQCAAKDAQIADAQQDCADARSLLRETEEELAATALDLTAANVRIAELETMVLESHERVSELAKDCEYEEARAGRAEAAAACYAGEVGSAGAENANLRDAVKRAEARIAELEEAHKDALANVVVAHAERLAAAARAERAEAERDALRGLLALAVQWAGLNVPYRSHMPDWVTKARAAIPAGREG